jgi:hypothetical protein
MFEERSAFYCNIDRLFVCCGANILHRHLVGVPYSHRAREHMCDNQAAVCTEVSWLVGGEQRSVFEERRSHCYIVCLCCQRYTAHNTLLTCAALTPQRIAITRRQPGTCLHLEWSPLVGVSRVAFEERSAFPSP